MASGPTDRAVRPDRNDGWNEQREEGRYFSLQTATEGAPHMDGEGGWVTVRKGDLNPDRRGAEEEGEMYHCQMK